MNPEVNQTIFQIANLRIHLTRIHPEADGSCSSTNCSSGSKNGSSAKEAGSTDAGMRSETTSTGKFFSGVHRQDGSLTPLSTIEGGDSKILIKPRKCCRPEIPLLSTGVAPAYRVQ